MGIALDRFYLHPPPTPNSPHGLVRARRPAGPNAAQPAVDFADDLADAKADAIYRAWHRHCGAEGSPAQALGACSPLLDEDTPEDRTLLALYGGELKVFWTTSERHPTYLQIGPGEDEAAFWRWLDDCLSERRLASLHRPARRICVRLLTEAELRLVDAPLLLVEDVDWLTAEEFDHLHRRGGLAELIAGLDPQLTRLPPAEIRAAKLSLVQRALADDHRREDRRSAAFRTSELARLDADAAGAEIERLSRTIVPGDDHRGIGWALAYALHILREWPGRPPLIAQLRERSGAYLEVLFRELEGLSSDEAQ